jgi:gliding motility-associated-like protein
MKHITKVISAVFIVTAFFTFFMSSNTFAQNQQPTSCSNADFETGTFAGWLGYTGTCCPINTPTPGIVPGRHTIVTGPGTDPQACNAFPIVAPGGNFSAQLGNPQVGAQAERLTYTFTVSSANALFIYKYAVVMQDPGHTPASQPRFEMSVRDQNNNIIDPICGFYQVVAAPNNPGFFNCGSVRYRPWTTVGMDLTAYIGQPITIDFATGDCALTGHFAYAYIDAWCGAMAINVGYCNNSNSATLTAPSGFTYLWSTGATTQSITITNPIPNSQYTCTLTSVNGCNVTLTATLVPQNITTTTNVTNVTCNGGSNGSVTANPSGGTSPYSYNWQPGGCTTQTCTGLQAGTYTVIITDFNGCLDTATVTITQPPSTMTLTANGTNVTCNGNANGQSTATVTGGSPPYSYSWTPSGQTTSTATGLGAGTYTVVVTDSMGCTISQVVTITEPPVLATSMTSSNVLCNGGNTGSAAVTVSGGTPGYSYTWLPSGGTSSSATGIPQGTYTVLVTDANGCTTSATVTITEPPAIQITPSSTNVLCNGGNTGSASVTVSGGTPGYSYNWIPSGGTNASATGLPAGSYTVTVTDANGCTSAQVINVAQPPALNISMTPSSTVCPGSSNTISATVSGGTPGYTYAWNNGNTNSSQTVNPTVTTSYTITVTDANGCTATASLTLTVYPPVIASVSPPASYCVGSSATVSVNNPTGGNGSYTYNWNPNIGNGTGPYTVSPSTTTTYTVVVTDGCGLTWTGSTTITVNPSPLAAFTCPSTPVMVGQPITFTDGSTGATSWNWFFGDGFTSNAQNPSHVYNQWGFYTVTLIVTNQFGCTDTTVCDIRSNEDIWVPNVFTPNGDGFNEFFTIYNIGMVEYYVVIYDRWGLKMFETNDQTQHWDGKTPRGGDAPDGTYYYIVRTKSFTNKDYEFKGFLTLLH